MFYIQEHIEFHKNTYNTHTSIYNIQCKLCLSNLKVRITGQGLKVVTLLSGKLELFMAASFVKFYGDL